jgi:hypothetical protein
LRNFLIPFASFLAALSLFSASALAATTPTSLDSTPVAASDGDELPPECQLTVAPAATPGTSDTSATSTATTVATPTATADDTDSLDDEDDEDGDEAEHKTGHAIRACISALHENGEHGIGQTVSEFAHQLNGQRHEEQQAEHGRKSESTAPPVGSPTPTATATAIASTASTGVIAPALNVAPSRDQKRSDHQANEHGHKRGGD